MMSKTRVESHLSNWAAWMRSGTGARGYPGRVPGMMVGGNIASWEDLCDTCDKSAARITDASIADLLPEHQQAINHIWMATYFPPRRLTVAQYYSAAVIDLGEMLDEKGLV